MTASRDAQPLVVPGLWLAIASAEAMATSMAEDAACALHRPDATTLIDVANFIDLDLHQHDMLLESLLATGRPLIVLATARAFAAFPDICVSLAPIARVVAGHAVSGHAAMHAAAVLGQPGRRYGEVAATLALPEPNARTAGVPVASLGSLNCAL